ncbi:hypothetical protein Tco_0284895 [Tanacetum coccineum]
MDDPNITMEEYIRLEEEKSQRHGRTFNCQTATYSKMEYCEDEDDSFMNFETEYPTIVFDDTSDATLSCEPTVSPLNEIEINFRISFDESDDKDYMVKGYSEDIVHSYEQRLETIWGRSVNQVHVLDFSGLTKGIRQTLGDRLRIVYIGDEGQELFTSHAWRRLFEMRAPLVQEFILEFLSTCKVSDTEIGLDVVDTFCFQLGGVRGRMTWRQFLLALGLHTDEEMAKAGFGAYRLGSESVIHDKGDLREYWIEISGQTPEKVTGVDLFYLRSMNRGTANVSYLLAQYLFRHAEGRKSGARLSGVTSLGVLQLILDWVGDTLAWVAPGPERQSNAAAGAPRAAKDALAVDEGAQADLAPVQAPQPLPPAPMTMKQRISRLEEEDECPKNIDSDVVKNMKKPSQTPRGVPVGPKVGFKLVKRVYRQVSKKNNVNTSGNKKKEVSNLNPFDVLNSVENNVNLGTNGGTSNLASKKANSGGSSLWNVESSSTSTTPIIGKINEMERLIIDGKVTLVDDEGKPLTRVVSSGDHDSEDEVASVDNDMANFLASKKDGYGTNSLLEQWKGSYGNGDYDFDPYDYDMYEGQDIPDKIQDICDNLDIKVRGRKKK